MRLVGLRSDQKAAREKEHTADPKPALSLSLNQILNSSKFNSADVKKSLKDIVDKNGIGNQDVTRVDKDVFQAVFVAELEDPGKSRTKEEKDQFIADASIHLQGFFEPGYLAKTKSFELRPGKRLDVLRSYQNEAREQAARDQTAMSWESTMFRDAPWVTMSTSDSKRKRASSTPPDQETRPEASTRRLRKRSARTRLGQQEPPEAQQATGGPGLFAPTGRQVRRSGRVTPGLPVGSSSQPSSAAPGMACHQEQEEEMGLFAPGPRRSPRTPLGALASEGPLRSGGTTLGSPSARSSQISFAILRASRRAQGQDGNNNSGKGLNEKNRSLDGMSAPLRM